MVELIETQLAAITAANLVKSQNLNLLDRVRLTPEALKNLISKISEEVVVLEQARKKVANNLGNLYLAIADDGFKAGNSDWLILSLHRAENALKGVTAASKTLKALAEEMRHEL